MEEMQQITLDQWLEWKEDIREKLRETAGNFVHIGFRLKQIRDSGMLDGAADIFEFATKEYGLSKSSTSRFIAINEKFSEGGNSLELREEYKAIGSSKLAEMLTLSDAECRLITERTTVKEIRELKTFSRQQASEAEEAGEKSSLNPLQKCLVDYFKDKREMLNEVMREAYIYDNLQKAVELMNPSGYGTHKKGLCFMFMYDFNTGVKVKLLTEPEPQEIEWDSVLLELYNIYGDIFESGERDIHGAYYGGSEGATEEMPEKRQNEAAGEEPAIDVTEVEKNAENQNAEAPDADSVATSQQEEKSDEDSGHTGAEESPEESSEETVEKPERQEADEEPEIGVAEVEETAENQNVEDPGADSVATSQQEDPDEPEDEIICREREKISRTKIWTEIENAEDNLNEMVLRYNMYHAANGEIPLKKLKKAYQLSIDMAAGFERLIMDAEKRGEADE